MGNAGNGQTALRVHRRHTAQRRSSQGATMVCIAPTNNDLALGLPLQIPITPHQANISVVAFTAT